VRRVAVVVLALGCTRPVPPPAQRPALAPATDISDQNWSGPPLDHGQLVLHDAYGGTHPVDVEIADTTPSRTRGLMWRSTVSPGTGMLFIFPSEQEQKFWMRNTLVPLDMLFLDRTGLVVGIVAQAEPKTLDSRTVGRPSLYVLEVAGGWAETAGVVPGSRAELQGSLSSRPGQP
jgi:uncharacterized membrane protein (UPF0127 family)